VTWNQTSLFGEEVPVSAASPVYSFDPSRFTNGMRVVDLARLGYLPEPVLDPTYGGGGMWTIHRPHVVRCDLADDRARDVRCDVRELPFRDAAFGSCLLDPPYKLTHDVRAGRDDLTTRFDASANRHLIIDDAVRECARVTRQWLIVKAQDQTEGWRFVHQTRQVIEAAGPLGWRTYDFVHLVNYIEQPAGRPQRSARHNYSTFVILKRGK